MYATTYAWISWILYSVFISPWFPAKKTAYCGICDYPQQKDLKAKSSSCNHKVCYGCLLDLIDRCKLDNGAPIICPAESCSAVVKEFTHNGNIFQSACFICGHSRYKDNKATTSPCQHSFCHGCLKAETDRCKQEKAPYICPAPSCSVVITRFTHGGNRIYWLGEHNGHHAQQNNQVVHERPNVVCGICLEPRFRGNKAITPCFHLFCFRCLIDRIDVCKQERTLLSRLFFSFRLKCPSCPALLDHFKQSGGRRYDIY